MNRFGREGFWILVIILVITGSLKAADVRADFFVAQNGADTNPGTEAQPFASLSRARDAVRELKAHRKGPITVMVRGGKYYLKQTLVLTAEDSGAQESPITYEAYPGETVIVSGGEKVGDWKPYRGTILRGSLCGRKVTVSEARVLTYNGKLMRRSRWPKYDAKVNPFWGVRARLEGPAEPGSMIAFKYKAGDFPRSITKPQEAELNLECGYTGPWANCVLPVASIDSKNRVVTLQLELWHSEDDNFVRYRHMPFFSDQGYVLENVLEGLNEPGEWYLDAEEGSVYFWPPDNFAKNSEVVVPELATLIDLEGTSYVTLSGFAFTETTSGENMHRFGLEGYGAMFPVQRWNYCGESIHLKDTKHCTIEKSRFYALGGNAIYLEGFNLKDEIRRNNFSYVGANGVCLLGRKEQSWMPLFNQVTNNYFDHTGMILYYTAAIFSGMSSGNRFAHNTIHDLPHHGINLSTNGYGRNVVEFNDIRRTTLALNDTGAINSWMDEYEMPYPDDSEVYIKRNSQRSGHIIRYNYIDGSQQGLYLDDWTSDCFVYGNIIVGTRNGITVHGGTNNVVENNLIVNSIDRGIGYWSCCYERPEAVHMAGFGWGNRYRNNIIYNSATTASSAYQSIGPAEKMPHFYLMDFWRPSVEVGYADRELAESDYNLFYSARGIYDVHDKDRGIKTLEEWRRWGYDTHSLTADPLLVDPEHGDFHLRAQSPAFRLGFQPIPVGLIGVQKPE